MKTMVKIGTLGLASLVTTGLIGFQTTTAHGDDDGAFKRTDDTPDLVMAVEDEDDDDTGARERADTRSRDTRSRNTGTSRSTRDHTNSRFTKVSRDRDLSRSDKTRDRTTDGPGKSKRDWSANSTNDRSRNDTRR